MFRREFLSRAIRLAVVSGVAVELTGCGTVMHSERVGQPHSRDIDWKVAGLNGLGLILFFVPGVIAFAVDFYTGAIYLPDESFDPTGHDQNTNPQQISQLGVRRPQNNGRGVSSENRHRNHQLADQNFSFDRIHLAVDNRNIVAVEQLVSKKLGHPIRINDNQSRVSQLTHLDQFASSYKKHLQNPDFGTPTQRFFEDLPTA